MSRVKNILTLVMIFTIFCMVLSPINSSAQSFKNKGENVESKDVQALANELEYLFTKILIEDEDTGTYSVDMKALDKSHYTKEEKKQLREFVKQQQKYNKNNEFTTYNTFDRCMQDLLGISSTVWKEIKGYIDAEQYIAAASALVFAAGVAVNPITIAIFVLTCGPSSAG